MTIIDEALEISAANYLAAWGEPVQYLPSGGTARNIQAVVDRETPTQLDDMPHVHAPRLVIHVANDSIIGISSAEINISNDKILVPVRIGETAVQKLITKIIAQDPGMMRLEVR
jgi:hypothetical protein